MKNNKTNKIVKIGVFAAVASVLMCIEFPFPLFPTFLKFDFGDVPALIGTFALGPIAGVVIELVKNIVKVLLKGTITVGIGEIANFGITAVWVFVAGIIYKRNKTKKTAMIALVTSTIVMSVFGALFNYLVLLPMYQTAFHMQLGNLAVYAATIIFPFNMIKGAVVSLATLLLYKKVSVALKLEHTSLEVKKEIA